MHIFAGHAIEKIAITKQETDQLLSIEEIRVRLAGADIPEIVKATGLSYNTVKAIRDNSRRLIDGSESGARYETIKLLTEFFEGRT